MKAKVGKKAFLSACTLNTRHSDTPFARAIQTKSSFITSANELRVSCAMGPIR